jgi:hypothetical protein
MGELVADGSGMSTTIYEMLSAGCVMSQGLYAHKYAPNIWFSSRKMAIRNAFNIYREHTDIGLAIRASERLR